MFFKIARSFVNAAAVSLNGITISSQCLSTFSINSNPGFSNSPRSLSINSPH